MVYTLTSKISNINHLRCLLTLQKSRSVKCGGSIPPLPLKIKTMMKILSWLPFIGTLTVNMWAIIMFALTGSLGFLVLLIPGILALYISLDYTKE